MRIVSTECSARAAARGPVRPGACLQVCRVVASQPAHQKPGVEHLLQRHGRRQGQWAVRATPPGGRRGRALLPSSRTGAERAALCLCTGTAGAGHRAAWCYSPAWASRARRSRDTRRLRTRGRLLQARRQRRARCAALPTAYAPSRHAAAPACSSSRSALVGGRYISSQTHRLNCSTGLRKLQAGHSRRSAGGDAARRRATGPQQCG